MCSPSPSSISHYVSFWQANSIHISWQQESSSIRCTSARVRIGVVCSLLSAALICTLTLLPVSFSLLSLLLLYLPFSLFIYVSLLPLSLYLHLLFWITPLILFNSHSVLLSLSLPLCSSPSISSTFSFFLPQASFSFVLCSLRALLSLLFLPILLSSRFLPISLLNLKPLLFVTIDEGRRRTDSLNNCASFVFSINNYFKFSCVSRSQFHWLSIHSCFGCFSVH